MTLMASQPGQPPISTAALYISFMPVPTLLSCGNAEIICACSQNTWLTGKFFATSAELAILCSRTGGAYAIRISRRAVPSRFYMTFNPILRQQSGSDCSCDIVPSERIA
jgi:hypothetical protein